MFMDTFDRGADAVRRGAAPGDVLDLRVGNRDSYSRSDPQIRDGFPHLARAVRLELDARHAFASQTP